ncbi:unnamed protein product [Larinioides sclopetarius]|uniref:Uncharacterized protein n=1 Tax=Larinioides sclopetarius TaxID=280406 RepID=A0AAV2AC43_9ARAC
MLRSGYCSSMLHFAITSEVRETTLRSYLAPIILDEKVSFDRDFMLGSVKYYRGDFGYILLAFSEEQPQSCQSVRGNLHI